MKAVGILTTCLVNPCQAQGEKTAWQSQDFAHLFPVDQLSRRFVRLLRRSECFQPVKLTYLTFPFRILQDCNKNVNVAGIVTSSRLDGQGSVAPAFSTEQ